MWEQLTEILKAVSGSAPVKRSMLGDLPTAPGAYLLLLHLERPLRPPIRRLAGLCLDPGSYVYGGNAYGPGGIAARVRRHFRPAKRTHWHIDHLSEAARDLAAFPCPGGQECALLEALLAQGGFVAAAKGFGSTDCRSCESHLLQPLAGRF